MCEGSNPLQCLLAINLAMGWEERGIFLAFEKHTIICRCLQDFNPPTHTQSHTRPCGQDTSKKRPNASSPRQMQLFFAHGVSFACHPKNAPGQSRTGNLQRVRLTTQPLDHRCMPFALGRIFIFIHDNFSSHGAPKKLCSRMKHRQCQAIDQLISHTQRAKIQKKMIAEWRSG